MTREGKRDWLSYFKTEDGNIFFGWYTVLVSSLTGLWQAGTWYYGFGAYFKPLSEEFGWTRATTSALWSLGRFEGGLEGPFGGIATDKWGPRAIHFMGVVLSGLGFVLMYFTRDFSVRRPNLSTPYGIIDYPLSDFRIQLSYLKMHLTCAEYEPRIIESEIFTVPDDYRHVSRPVMEEIINSLFTKE